MDIFTGALAGERALTLWRGAPYRVVTRESTSVAAKKGGGQVADAPVSVFISYSRKDSAFVDHLEADLRAYGFTTWVDRQHLEGGDDWASKIEQQILAHEAFVVTLSPDAITSDWVRREITFALDCGRHIIPIIARPVTSAPISIIEKQRIDLSSNYSDGLQELRIILLKLRALPAPPTPAHTPQPLLAPDISDPLKGLVEIPPAPPAPNTDLNAIFMQAQAALARGSLDLAEALLRQLVERDSHFGNDLAAEDLDRVRKRLAPVQIERLQRMASESRARGAWGEEIGALRALADRMPDDESVADRLEIAEECQKWAWLYENARTFAEAQDITSVATTLTRLWEKAPNYGDPAHIAPPGLELPPIGLTPAARRYASLPHGHTILTFQAHTNPISALRWSPNGSCLATTCEQQDSRRYLDTKPNLCVWDVRSGKCIAQYVAGDFSGTIYDIAWMPDGRRLVSASGTVVHLWQVPNEAATFTFEVGASRSTISSSIYRVSVIDFDSFAGIGLVGSIQAARWNARTGACIPGQWFTTPRSNWNKSAPVYDTRWSPGGVWLSTSLDQYVDIVSAQHLLSPNFEASRGGRENLGAIAEFGVNLVNREIKAQKLTWSPNSEQLLVTCSDNTIRAFRPRTGNWARPTTSNQPGVDSYVQVIETLSCGGHAGPVTAATWSPDGKRLASACSDGVRIWDASSAQLLYRYTKHESIVQAVEFSPDSSRIASGDAQGLIHIWKP